MFKVCEKFPGWCRTDADFFLLDEPTQRRLVKYAAVDEAIQTEKFGAFMSATVASGGTGAANPGQPSSGRA